MKLMQRTLRAGKVRHFDGKAFHAVQVLPSRIAARELRTWRDAGYHARGVKKPGFGVVIYLRERV